MKSDIPHRHFSRLSGFYRNIRTTDKEPVQVIKKELEGLSTIKAADIGCGAGRYERLFFSYLGERLSVCCIDENKKMLLQLRRYLAMCNLREFTVARAVGGEIPISTDSLDCLFTFNAVHHFNLVQFLKESARVLRNTGYLFMYTRVRSQNKRNIWGRYFPDFYEKENRLYQIGELTSAIREVPSLILQSVEYFRYKRLSNLWFLTEQVRKHHYSTFSLYEKKELEDAIGAFRENIRKVFPDLKKITWVDENTMLIIKRG